ncbi:TadE/TadG family type IV pilus assembly protein [Bradyrhizobium sp. PMVTL-01]|uniref:TadE/TadG family type IV pilus assembly protein n=1 Tax=Bradyrhizobium sp. PMVTL-01 TaxID=3434999 RepID=UPI003F72F0FB
MILCSVVNQLLRLRTDEKGAVSVMMGFLLVPLVGFLAIGFEVSNWYLITRSMQNAADAATVAAAINNGANYDVEARAVAAQYGFVNGASNVSVAVTNTAACPGGGNSCYSVTISGYTPLLLSQIVGFQGDANFNGTLEKKLSAAAVAKQTTVPQEVCLLALASSGAPQGIRTNGAPTGNMNGCDSMSNTAAQCNGSNLGLGISFAVGSNNGCGAKQMSSPALTDPYYYLASNIPALSSSGCAGNYPQESKHGNSYTVAASNQRTGTLNLSAGNNFLCGDQLLTGDVTINTPVGQPAVLIIENGQLDLNGHTLTTSSGSAVTLVFSGTNGSYMHAPTDNTNGSGGVLDITPPTTGTWKGVAIYQDPSLTTGVDVSAAGNSPTWNVTGLVYMPHASLTLKGAIDKSTFGKSCLVMVADNFQISGTGGVLKTDIGQCGQAGLTMPTAKIPGGAVLVL